MRVREERTAGGFVGHTEDSESIGALDVKDISVLRVRDMGVIVSRNLLEDLPGDSAGVGRRRRELCQHHRSPRYQRVQYRHSQRSTKPPLSLSSLFVILMEL